MLKYPKTLTIILNLRTRNFTSQKLKTYQSSNVYILKEKFRQKDKEHENIYRRQHLCEVFTPYP